MLWCTRRTRAGAIRVDSRCEETESSRVPASERPAGAKDPIPVFVLVCAILLGLTSISTVGAEGPPTPGPAASQPRGKESATAPGWFGWARLVELHLEVPTAAWDTMGSAGGPAERRSGFGEPVMEGGAGILESLRRRWFEGPTAAPAADAGRSSSGYPWATCELRCHGQVLNGVAIRFKGASSMVRSPNAYKRPFKLDFQRGHPGRRLFGESEISLGNNVNDATQMREALAYELFRRAGIPAPRTGFARVTLTVPGRVENRLLGLYTVVEAVDGEFEDQWLGGRGLLMKPERMQGIGYLGESWDAYRDRYHPEEPPTGIPAAQSDRVIGFARWLRDTDGGRFGAELEQWLQPEAFGRFVAMNALLANVDSFLGNGHNYYLHLQPRTGRLTFVPWDLNEAFGMHPVSGPSRTQMRFSVLRPNGDPNELVERFVSDARYGPLYRGICANLLTNLFVPSLLAMDIDRIAALTGPVVLAESRQARQEFERTVKGIGAEQEILVTQPRFDAEWAGDGYRPWGFPPGVEIDHLPLKEWITGRAAHVAEELQGRTRGLWPRPRL